MSEFDWDRCTYPTSMLEFLRNQGRTSVRKLRLFSCACCRRIWSFLDDERLKRAVMVAEAYADGSVTRKVLRRAFNRLQPAYVTVAYESAHAAVWCASNPVQCVMAYSHAALVLDGPPAWDAEHAIQAALLRDIFGPWPIPPLTSSVLAWNDGLVVKLATAIYKERCLPTGELNNDHFAVLSDALEEAGCHDENILYHCREQGQVHVRGCWLLDLILEKA